jgi:hypothetical protein
MCVLGELQARGCAVPGAAQLAGGLTRKQVDEIVRRLRRTMSCPRDPTRLDELGNYNELELRQSLDSPSVDAVSVDAAAFYWTRGWLDLPRRQLNYGRALLYAVLAHARPEMAVSLAFELRDPSFFSTLFNSLHRYVHAWPPQLTPALLHAPSGVLRAFGAFSLAGDEDRAGHGHSVRAPQDVDAAVRTMIQYGWSTEEVRTILVRWGIDALDPGSRGAVSSGLLSTMLSSDDARESSAAVDRAVAHAPFFESFAAVTSAARHAGALRSVVRAFAARITALVDPNRASESRLSLVLDRGAARSAGRVAAALAEHEELSVYDVIAEAVGLQELFGRVTWLSPFRARPGAPGADEALGWSLLWMLDAAPLGAAAVRDAERYIGLPAFGATQELRDLIRTALVARDSQAREV